MARVRPLVVVIEDLHWIDPASEEYLTFLADVVPAARALLVCSYRPGYRHVLGDRSYHVRVLVQPLSDAEMARVAGAVLGVDTLPPEVAALIARKADGNALFVEEVTKSLLEDGSLRRDGDRVALGRALAELAVPDSIHGVLMARIDRLDDDPKRALQMASIIGREFALRLLARVSEVGDRVPHLVHELRALEIIYEKAAHPELAYMFKHALVHDVAYESVLLEQRRRLHRVIGTAIEELYADRLPEHYETLALHFTRGEDWKHALTYHTLAARKAAEAYANHAVIEHARAGLAIVDRLGNSDLGPHRQELEELIGMASLLTSAFRASGEAFVRAADAASEPQARAIDLGHAGHSFTWAHAYPEARRVLEQAGALARANGFVVAEALGVANDGFLHQTLGELDAAERLSEAASAIAERSGSEELRAVTQFFHGILLDWRGDFRRAAPLFAAAREVGQRRRLPNLVVLPQWFLGKATCGLGDYGRSVALLRDAVELCDKIGDRAWKTRCQNTLGWCLAEIGAHPAALGENRRAAALAQEIGDQEIRANAELNLAANHLALGDLDAAFARVDPIRAE
ncbi:MAG: ATP-binding protein, partial [Candidatus Rokuibacteriota bacterium]